MTASGERSSLRRDTAKTLAGNLSVTGLQAAQFIMLARLLGVSEFGRLSAVNAMLVIAGPLADLGFSNLLVMRCAVDRKAAPREVSNALVVTSVVGGALVGVLMLAASLIYGQHIGYRLMFLLGVAELVGFRCVNVCAQFHLSFDRFGTWSTLSALASVCRVAALAIPCFFPAWGAEGWAVAVAALATLLVLVVVGDVRRRLGRFDFSLRHTWSSLREAIHFSLGTSARGVYTDLDKVMLGAYGTPVELGAYTSAYRLVAMAFIPVKSLLQASVGRYFRAGTTGLKGTVLVTRQLLRYSVPYSVASAVGLYVVAPIVPVLLGHSFAHAVPVVRALAVLPIIQSLQYVYSDALTGAGHQAVRTRLQFLVVAFYAALGLFLIPRYHWVGAAITCISGEGLLALMMVAVVRLLGRPVNDKHPAGAPAAKLPGVAP